MGNDTVKDCKHYGDCDILRNDINELKKSDTLQEASLKSIHKMMDIADKKRDAQTKEIHQLRETIHDTHTNLTTHMEWEEKLAEIKDKEHKDKRAEQTLLLSRVKTFGTVIFTAIFGLITWFTSYVFTGLNENNDNIISMKQHQLSTDKKMTKIDNNIDDIKKMLYPLTRIK